MSDLSTTSWSEVDASNSTFPPEGWPAGMFPNAVEPTARMMMGAMKRFWNRVSPVYAATLTTTDTYAVTETQAMAGYSLYEKRATRFPAANVNSSPTVNHSSLGAVFFKKWDGAGNIVNLATGDIQAQEHEYYWDGIRMVLLNPTSGVLLGNTNKATPTSSDSFVLTDAAAANAQKVALLSAFPLSTIAKLLAAKASPNSSDSVVITDSAANNVGKSTPIGALVAAGLAPQIFTKSFTSTTTAIVSGGAVAMAHGLGVAPLLVQCRLQCVTNEAGFVAGQQVIYGICDGSTLNHGLSMAPDTTNMNIRYGSDVNAFVIPNASTGAGAPLTNINWTLVVKAWA